MTEQQIDTIVNLILQRLQPAVLFTATTRRIFPPRLPALASVALRYVP
ncbi:TPA: hypothetical protein ACG6EA_004249 [Escherichia coli]